MSRRYEIVPLEGTQSDSGDQFFCPLCGFMLSSESDHQQYSDHSCCNECYLTFAESRKKEWATGWRPKKSEVRKYINKRKRLIINTSKRQET